MSGPADDLGLARAQAMLAANRPEEALRELATLPAATAVGAAAFRLRAEALLDLERWPEAADAARRGLAAGGPEPDLLHQLAVAEQRLGNPAVAERAVLDGLALHPFDVGLLCTYAELCWEAQQFDKAAKLVARAAEQRPESPTVYAARARLAYARGDDREAQRISREYVAAYPADPAAHALLGGVSGVRGQVRPAYEGLRQAAGAQPTTVQYAEAALDARIATHPLLVPVRPFIRFGPVKTWLVAIAAIYGLRAVGLPVLSFALAVAWIALCVYSWVVPPIVRRWVRRRWR